MVPLIDIHCHLDFPELYEQIEEVIKKAQKAQVEIILTNGIDPKTNRIALELAEKYGSVESALGFYPPDYSRKAFNEEEFSDELAFISKNKDKIAAIGEIGMDYKNVKDKELQKMIFTKLVKLAKNIDKPMLIHSRKAEEDVIDILEKEGAKKVIMHCFSGKKKLIERASDLGYYFSIPTAVVKSEQFQETIKIVPINQLFAETDAPFLSPFKDKRNEPAFIVESYKKIAEIKNMTLEEVRNNIFMNWQGLF
ncbi:TatD family hydrolase [Candidatus Woesearchaeota archaeon]|nr:TatD family hydrolase [Candidatus Woesearchaeota archaeon]